MTSEWIAAAVLLLSGCSSAGLPHTQADILVCIVAKCTITTAVPREPRAPADVVWH